MHYGSRLCVAGLGIVKQTTCFCLHQLEIKIVIKDKEEEEKEV